MVTIREVALQAKVSLATVSHVLNDTRYVEETTRQRVLEAVEALGYRPNHMARSLRSRQTRLIGLLVPDSEPVSAALVQAIETAFFTEGLSVIVGHCDGDEKGAQYLENLLSKPVDGLVFVGMELPAASLRSLVAADTPAVFVDREIEGFDCVSVDHEAAGFLAGRHLVSLGHRLACLLGPDNAPNARRKSGFERALARSGFELSASAIAQAQDGEAAMRELLERGTKATAVFALNDQIAMGALRALRQNEIGVPDDISLIGCDDLPQSAILWPALTSIAQPMAQIGAATVSCLMARLQNRGAEIQRLVLPPTLIERESCRALIGA